MRPLFFSGDLDEPVNVPRSQQYKDDIYYYSEGIVIGSKIEGDEPVTAIPQKCNSYEKGEIFGSGGAVHLRLIFRKSSLGDLKRFFVMRRNSEQLNLAWKTSSKSGP